MPRNQTEIENSGYDWVEASNGDVAGVYTLQPRYGPVFLRFTVGAVKPDITETGVLMTTKDTILQKTIADTCSLTNATRIWFRPASSVLANVYIDHA